MHHETPNNFSYIWVMKKYLLKNNQEIHITNDKSLVIDSIYDKLLDTSIGYIYGEEEITQILFHYKGYERVIALYVQVFLAVIESEDILESVDSNLKSSIKFSNTNGPGLWYMNCLRSAPLANSTVYSFWYEFTEEEKLIYNM